MIRRPSPGRSWKAGARKGGDIVVAPVFTALAAVHEVLKGSPVALAAQDVFYEEKGAYTGEVAPTMLVDAGCAYVIIGHSERRKYFHETDETVNAKVKKALSRRTQTHPVRGGDGRGEGEGGNGVRGWPPGEKGPLRPREPRCTYDRLRAGLGDRHWQERDTGPGRGRACLHQGIS